MPQNVDNAVVKDFGHEWERFDQSALSETERLLMFQQYFSVFPWGGLPPAAIGFDAGCGTGRWALLVAPRVGHLYCIDPSSAIEIAKTNLRSLENCSFHRATIDAMPLADSSMDFGYSLGVLHHIPDSGRALADCVSKLKVGAPFLVYLYYAFDNQPAWFRGLWRISDRLRRGICRLPFGFKRALTDTIAALLYYPLARTALLLEKCGSSFRSFPLSAYRHRSFYSMRTDALDRFGTSLERRFTQAEIRLLMESAGLERITFSSDVPFWCAVGYKK